MRYFANFDGDEYDGTRYEIGEEVKGLDAGTLAYLLREGRITERPDDDDGEGSALGDAGVNTGIPSESVATGATFAHGGEGGQGGNQGPGRLSELDKDDGTLKTDVGLTPPAPEPAPAPSPPPTPAPAPAAPPPPPPPSTADSFVPAALVAGNVEDTVGKLDGLKPEQLDQVEAAERARPGGARKGVTDAIEAKRKG